MFILYEMISELSYHVNSHRLIWLNRLSYHKQMFETKNAILPWWLLFFEWIKFVTLSMYLLIWNYSQISCIIYYFKCFVFLVEDLVWMSNIYYESTVSSVAKLMDNLAVATASLGMCRLTEFWILIEQVSTVEACMDVTAVAHKSGSHWEEFCYSKQVSRKT